MLGLLISLVGLVAVNAQSVCPNLEDFSPCTCDYEAINCNYALDSGELRQAFKSYVKETRFRFLWISNTGINHLANDTFGKYMFQVANLQYNKIRSVDAGVFSIMSGFIKEINLSHNELKFIPIDAFIGLKRLTSLRLEFNLIKTVDVFPRLPALDSIRLENNIIDTIKPYAFSELTSLITIEMSANYLETITDYSFGTTFGVESLRDLRLIDNEITKISPYAFHGLRTIPNLYLRKNKIQILDKDFWIPFLINATESRNNADLSENPIECSTTNLLWLINYEPESSKNRISGVFCNGKPLPNMLQSDLGLE